MISGSVIAFSFTQTCAGRPARACSTSAARPSRMRGFSVCGEIAIRSSSSGRT